MVSVYHKPFHDREPSKTGASLDARVHIFHIFVVEKGILIK